MMKKLLIGIAIFCLGALAFWAFSPLLIDKEIQDEFDPALQARLEAQRRVDESRAKVTATEQETPTTDTPNITTENNTPENAGIFESEIVVEGPFNIIGTPLHPASGQIEIIRSPKETLIQYKNYNGTNGPDLKIYLAKDLDAKEFISLGNSRSNKGNIIYGTPLDIDFNEYLYILTWSETLGVLFDYVKIK